MSYNAINTPVSRRVHICLWCGEKIEKEIKYILQSGAIEDCHYRNKYHTECYEALEKMHKEDHAYLDNWFDENCMWKHKRGTKEER